MRQRDDSVFLRHIRDAILLVEQYLQGVGPKKFKESTLLQDGAIRQIQIIGEAAKLLSSEFRQKHSHIPWRDMTGMRDKLVHDYFGVDVESVWKTATEDLPELKIQIAALLKTTLS